ncbi:hypothetical protein ACIA8K_05650 [Catenuloplanes sp. NPDC051500]|uniref:hypothetical protein n=1 Tax=Catenuloplanes sp. NPDC051500 TaxID=3363959 RepID=UPI0037B1585C
MATVQIDILELTRAAHALARAGRWADATRLVDAVPAPAEAPTTAASGTATPPNPAAELALAAAEVALEWDWFAGTDHAEPRLRHPALDQADPWAVAYARLRAAYLRQFSGVRDQRAIAALAAEADRLADQAPDAVRRGWALFYRGVIDDNLAGRRADAPARYLAALGSGDDLLDREALRHLGDHDHDAGHHEAALARWERATALGARAGAVTGTLSQQLLLAVLHRDAGDEAAAVGVAGEVARWSGALGATRLAASATAFLNGVDPTADPTDKTSPETGS